MEAQAASGSERDLPAAALALVAIGAAVAYQLALLLPLAIVMAVPALWYAHPFYLVVSAIGFVLLAWILQPDFRSGDLHYLARTEAPQLYAWADALARRCEAPPIDRIALDDELNAGALELHRGVSLRPTRRVLVLGVPLLALLDEEALRAVVAHELGHFSRRHGRFGHWLYRTRAVWLREARAGDGGDDSIFERATSAFARAFVPWFTKHSHSHSRRCEFEADAIAADIVSPAAMARALALIETAGSRWQRWFDEELPRLRRTNPSAPVSWLQTIAEAVRAEPACPSSGRRTRNHDTHPSLQQRCAAIAVAAVTVPFARLNEAAGPQLLGARWAGIESGFNAALAGSLGPAWPMLHAALGVLQEQSERAGLDAPERARLAWLLSDFSTARSAAVWRLSQSPSDPEARFYLAAASSEEDALVAKMREPLESAISAAPAWAAPMRAWLAAHAEPVGLDGEQQQRNLVLLRRALARRHAATRDMVNAAREGRCTTTSMRQSAVAVLSKGLASYHLAESAWCGYATAEKHGRRFEGMVLIARLDSAAMKAAGVDEEAAQSHLGELLDLVVRPDELGAVWTVLGTEPEPPSIAAGVGGNLARLKPQGP